MNTDYVLFNLKEAADDLQKAIAAADSDNEIRLETWLPFVYRKLNRAWNCRHMDAAALASESEIDFEKNCGFPDDLTDSVSDYKR